MTEKPVFGEEQTVPVRMWSIIRSFKFIAVGLMIVLLIVQNAMYHRKAQELQKFTETIKRTVLDMYNNSRNLNSSLKMEQLDSNYKVTIYAITPTFSRPVQKAELTRLAQAFMQVFNFHWIVVEDSWKRTKLVTNFLKNSGLRYTHLAVPTPPSYKLGKSDPNWKKPRGVEQRNAGLQWLRENLTEFHDGVVYFADDDNTYSLMLFREMRKIKTVGVWPVGLVGGLAVERPICDNATGKVVGFNAVWKPDRPFPLDMAGFAINLKLILENKDAYFSYEVQGGYQESEILRQIVTRDRLEPLADCCTKVYVWHTRTEPPQLHTEQLLIRKGKPSNAGIEV
ncbi:galactosylgalactosylxylosylprotein 3-beta-glucuronosyltransferase I [Orussus abietinus]|uniref:galactosylgalactosylxylosylprotein 3-beta-glucuronosyltransferase I n=1 Tax=Orussus abietinus TaxID=222816 RepID=UPI0006253DA0|nr:galactosylgalactosylxylosylprotein 3-beta-glucuronosyltransferase I [Orussus abietinus]